MLRTLETWARRVWAERDESAIDEMMTADTPVHGLGAQSIVGPDQFKAFHRAICAQLDDISLVVDHSIEADGWLAALCTFAGTTRDGRRVTIQGAIHARIAGERILEGYNHFDFVGLFVQLGLLPADALTRGIAGRPICGL